MQLLGVVLNKFWQGQLDAVHAVFALPEVKRATDLLPELVGIIEEFLSPHFYASEYVSIHAQPKPKHQWWQEVEGERAEEENEEGNEEEEKDDAAGSASAASASAPAPPSPDEA